MLVQMQVTAACLFVFFTHVNESDGVEFKQMKLLFVRAMVICCVQSKRT